MMRNEHENRTITTNNSNTHNSNFNNYNDVHELRNQWLRLKFEGDELFRAGQYRQASTAYQSALNVIAASSSSCTEGGREQGHDNTIPNISSIRNTNSWKEGTAILQSNLVACYLNLHEFDVALDLSQIIVRDNPRWAKGYVRLASTYSALHRSNDACNALQHALQLDPTHPTARSMLARELRGRNHHHTTTASVAATASTANLEEEIHSNMEQNAPSDTQWKDRILHHVHHFQDWYNALHSDYQSVLLVFMLLLSLYISFGGRFGLGDKRKNIILQHSHEEYNYYNGHQFMTTSTTSHDYYGQWKKQKNQKKQHLFTLQRLLPKHLSLLDGSVASMICLALILYVCYDRFGIQPLHVIMMIQWIQRANRHQPHPNFHRRFYLPHRRRHAFRF